MSTICQHRAPTIYSVERGFAVKGDCGSRARCFAARERWRRQTRQRLEGVEYVRVPDLWTITARTVEQDAERTARKFVRDAVRRGEYVHPSVRANPGNLAPLFLAGACAPEQAAHDRGDPGNKDDLREFQRGVAQLRRAIHRQWRVQKKPGYAGLARARIVSARYGTAYLVRGRPGADWRLSMKEAGEQKGRLHAHVASDFDFIHHGWLSDVARGYGLGFVQYSRRESAELKRAVWRADPRHRAVVIARYLAKYMAKGDGPHKPWRGRCIPGCSTPRTECSRRSSGPRIVALPSCPWPKSQSTVWVCSGLTLKPRSFQ